jgi:hypothetical protein
VLEPQALGGVVQLDVHAEVVGVELQFVAGYQAALLVDVEHEPGQLAVDPQPPVPVGVRMGVEGDHRSMVYTFLACVKVL